MDDSGRVANTNVGNGRSLRSGEKIFELVDVIEEGDIDEGQIIKPAESHIHDLVDATDKSPNTPTMNMETHDEIIKRVSVIAERIAREVIPEIAERVIREEIEKLKKDI